MATFKLSQSFDNSPLSLREKSERSQNNELEERYNDNESSDFTLETNSFSHLSMKDFYSYDTQKTPDQIFTHSKETTNFSDHFGYLGSADKVYNSGNNLKQAEINYSSPRLQENSGDHSERCSISSSRISITSQKSSSQVRVTRV